MTAEEYGYCDTSSSPSLVLRRVPHLISAHQEQDCHEENDAAAVPLLDCGPPRSARRDIVDAEAFPALHDVLCGHGGTPTQGKEEDDSMRVNIPAPMTTISRRSSLRQEGSSSRRNSWAAHHGEKGGDLVELSLPPTKVGDGQRVVVRRTSLTFQESAEYTTIESAQSLSCKKDLWFQQSEMKLIRKQVKAILQKTENGVDSVSGKRYCTRGLERLMQPQTSHRQRDVAWDAVLNEQMLQKRLGVFKEEALANLYKYSTMDSQKEAVIRAQADAKHAAKYLEGTRRMSM